MKVQRILVFIKSQIKFNKGGDNEETSDIFVRKERVDYRTNLYLIQSCLIYSNRRSSIPE